MTKWDIVLSFSERICYGEDRQREGRKLAERWAGFIIYK